MISIPEIDQAMNTLIAPGISTGATVPAKFLEICKRYPEKPALLYKKDHTFGYIQYKRLLNLVENFTLSLELLGIKKNDRVVVISENRPEWVVADLSVKSLGAILVPIHKTSTVAQVKSIVYEVEPTLFVVSDAISFNKARAVNKTLKTQVPVISLDLQSRSGNEFSCSDFDFISALKLLPHEDYAKSYENKLTSISPADVASILFTPNANGRYLGVQITHGNIISNVGGTLQAVNIWESDRFLSVLPLSHAFEETAGYYVPLFSGATISYLTDLSGFTKTAREYRPTVLIGVPRLYEKMYQRIVDGMNKGKLNRFIFDLAFQDEQQRSYLVDHILEKLVYKNIRDNLGGDLRLLISGGASLRPELGRFFEAIGIPMLEGYGLTEASPIVSVNRLENYRFGTVGHPIPGVNIRLADDGEILIKGSSISPGYFRNDEQNKLSFIDGWFKTGDLGSFDEDGFLSITGKKKELIILSTGKNVSPSSIESQLLESDLIEQVAVVGDGQKSIAALIVPDAIKLTTLFPQRDKKELLNDKKVRAFIQKEIDRLLANFARYEQIRNFVLIGQSFAKKDGTMTDEGFPIRQEIMNKYRKEIAGLYSGNSNKSLRVRKYED